jgi:hypothetical protein
MRWRIERGGVAPNFMYEPLYSAQGGAPHSFRCKVLVGGKYCNKPTRTERGMRAHCLYVHKIKAQMEMFDGKEIQQRTNAEFESVRAQRATARRRTNAPTGDLFA